MRFTGRWVLITIRDKFLLMKKFVLIGAFLHSFFLTGFSQSDRKTIIENKIRAITKVEYKSSSDKKKETKTFYTIIGEDSLKIINGETVFSFTSIVENGRTVQLERKSPKGLMDERQFL